MNSSPLATSKFTNPFMKRSTPAPTIVTADAEEVKDSSLPDPVAENPVANPFAKAASAPKNPFVFKPKIMTTTETVEDKKIDEPAVVSEAEAPVENIVNNVVDNTVETVEKPVENITNTEEVTTEPVSEIAETTTEATESTETENTDTTDNIEEAEKSSVVTENTTTKKRRRRTKQQIEEDNKAAALAKTTETDSIDETADELESEVEDVTVTPVKTNSVISNNSTIDFKTACSEFGSFCNDEEWSEFEQDVKTSYEDIKIAPDITTASLIGITCQLANLRDKIWNQHQYYKAQFDRLASKEPEGLIERTKRLCMDDAANNDMKRKKSSTAACMAYTTKDGHVINLYDFLDEVRARYYFLNAIMNNIEFKKNQLVTISSALKIENSLAN